jgi:SAM-dependent methyltransferase
MTIHRAAAAGFARGAGAYERARPDYPADAVSWLADRLGLSPGRVVVDLAAGTGKLTRALVPTGAEVIAVEPVAEMREGIATASRVLEGTAELIPLEDACADAVTVAQAFHWFDSRAALAEIHRILRPGGALGLIWNRRGDDPVNRSIEALMRPHRADTPAARFNQWRQAFEDTPLFGPLEEAGSPNLQELDADGLADRVGSTSFIAALPDREREAVLAQARAIAGDGTVEVRYQTEVQVTRRRVREP